MAKPQLPKVDAQHLDGGALWRQIEDTMPQLRKFLIVDPDEPEDALTPSAEVAFKEDLFQTLFRFKSDHYLFELGNTGPANLRRQVEELETYVRDTANLINSLHPATRGALAKHGQLVGPFEFVRTPDSLPGPEQRVDIDVVELTVMGLRQIEASCTRTVASLDKEPVLGRPKRSESARTLASKLRLLLERHSPFFADIEDSKERKRVEHEFATICFELVGARLPSDV